MTDQIAAAKPRVRVRAGTTLAETLLSSTAFAHLAPRAAIAAGTAAAAAATAPGPAAAAPAPAAAEGEPAPAPTAPPEASPAAEPARSPDGRYTAAAEDDPEGEEGDEGDEKNDDEENTGKRGKKRASARRRERARCAAILGSENAAANVPMACRLAFNTNLNRREALDLLASTPAPAPALAQAMTGYPNAPIGPSAPQKGTSQGAIDAGWDKAMEATAPAARPASVRQAEGSARRSYGAR